MSAGDPPLVTRPVTAAPRPGIAEGSILTIGFAAVLFGTMIVLFFAAAAWVYFRDGINPLEARPGADPRTMDALQPVMVEVLAWSFPVGYLAGFLAGATALRVVVGRGWVRAIGLRRLPPGHLALWLVALPAFSLLSDGLAQILYRAFGMEELLDQGGELGKLFHGFHPAFVLLAVGVGPGVVEEVWCRGFLGRGFVGRYGWFTGVAFSAAFFGLLHMWPPPYVLLTALMGACLHFAYACSRSLWVPITIHVANNGFAGLAAVGVVPTGGMDRAVANMPVLVYPLAAGVLLACGWAAWGARATSAGPRGVMVPPGGVVEGRLRLWPTLVALASGVALVVVLAAS